MPKIFFYTIITSFFLISCINKENKNETVKWNTVKDSLIYNRIKETQKNYKIESIENGYDSIQIRIWCDYSIIPTRQVFILKNNKKNWKAELHEVILKENSYAEMESKKVKAILPKSGWNSFTKKLFELDILSLPNDEEYLQNESRYDDATIYTVEIVMGKKFRCYNNEMPSLYEKKYWQAKKFSEILKLINEEFNIEL